MAFLNSCGVFWRSSLPAVFLCISTYTVHPEQRCRRSMRLLWLLLNAITWQRVSHRFRAAWKKHVATCWKQGARTAGTDTGSAENMSTRIPCPLGARQVRKGSTKNIKKNNSRRVPQINETVLREIFSVPVLLKTMYGTFKSELVKQNRPGKKR